MPPACPHVSLSPAQLCSSMLSPPCPRILVAPQRSWVPMGAPTSPMTSPDRLVVPTAATMVELGRDARDPDALAQALDSQLGDFAFPDEFVFDVWGAIGDAKAGRC